MSQILIEPSWKQHFPTYGFKKRDIALEEYKFATKTLEAEERVFLNAANLSVIVGAALGSLALGSLEKLYQAFTPILPRAIIPTSILLLAYSFGVLSLRYFADRQKSVAFAARKVIVLRRMLGMNYGSLQLVLPNWRIEGADEPFAIRMFPGWRTYVAYPCYAIAGIVATVSFFLLAELFQELNTAEILHMQRPLYAITTLAVLVFVALSWIYRKALLDTHERTGLLLTRKLSNWLRLRLIDNIEYVVYRATLATHELNRLSIGLKELKILLVQIEDREFYSHSGVSVRGLGRLFFSAFGRKPRSGGSTITQQIVRTLFIVDQSKVVRRKIIEIMLAMWFDKVIDKERQIELYLAAVRFESGVFGVAAAMEYFFDEKIKSPSAAEAFFLIERVSNIQSKLLTPKIDQTIQSTIDAGLLDAASAQAVVAIYEGAIRKGKIIDPGGQGIQALKIKWGDGGE